MTTAVSTGTGRDLNKLAKTANREHKACVDSQRAAAEHARDCGLALIEAKGKLPHGDWSAWVSQNCTFSLRTGQRHMLIASKWDQLQEIAGAKTTRASFFTIREALKILTGDRTPAEISEAIYCKSCGAQLAITSRHWATCINCWDCRLYGHDHQKEYVHNWDTAVANVTMQEAVDQMDRKQKRRLLRRLAKECGVTIDSTNTPANGSGDAGE